MSVTYKELVAEDAKSLIGLRLEVIETDPFSFSLTKQEELRTIEDVVREAIENYSQSSDQLILGAWDGCLVGVIGVERYCNEYEKHKVRIWGPYVLKERRKNGIGSHLLQCAIDHAFSIDDIEIAYLETASSSIEAHSLFEAKGFSTTGCQNKALLIEGQYIDLYTMQKAKHNK